MGRILIAVGFALSCFGLLLFLWVAFGGPVPLKPQSYRFSADFEEAITLSKEADVRISGVSVGKVKEIELPEDGNAARAVIELEPEYAPISSDARAILRQKTLLGETYVELTPGTQTDPEGTAELTEVSGLSGDDAVEPLPEGGHLADTQVAEQVQIDEIFNALDEETRSAFQAWMKNSGIAIEGRGLDLNNSFGNLGPFTEDASDVLATLREQEQALRTIVASTGQVFEALTARDQELAGAIVGSNRTFRALASRDEELADTFQVLPTFENESRLTLERLERFARNAGPLFRDLRPVARDLSPTLRDLRRLSPNARRLFENLDPLIDASIEGLPALRSILDQLRPTLEAMDPFLANLNPVVRYLDYQSATLADFLTSPPAGLAGQLLPQPGPAGAPPRASPGQLHQPREPLDLSRAHEHEPGQRLPAAVRHRKRILGLAGRAVPGLRLRQHEQLRRGRIGQRRARQRPGLEQPALEPAARRGRVVPALLAADPADARPGREPLGLRRLHHRPQLPRGVRRRPRPPDLGDP